MPDIPFVATSPIRPLIARRSRESTSTSCASSNCASQGQDIVVLQAKVAALEERLAGLEALLSRESSNSNGSVRDRKQKLPRDAPLSRSLRVALKKIKEDNHGVGVMVSAHSEAEKNNESIREKLTELAITLEQGSVSSNSPVLQAAARQIGALRANDLIRNEKRKIKGAAKPMDELLQQKRKAKIYQRKHRKLRARRLTLAANATKYPSHFDDIDFNGMRELFTIDMMSDEDDDPNSGAREDTRIRLVPAFRSEKMNDLIAMVDNDYVNSGPYTANRAGKISETKTVDILPPSGFKQKYDKWGFTDAAWSAA
ncbi:hypothetical protein HMPREF1544_12207 [Mucor circinelloides 1006PhL]|uniref:Uncharacterized protein n=1 Tax=Mucor circinelloides f. circinelloides (strain 1006PhL) TaxID=1220926 RepID=S2IUX5_MUCC1|nr:hypothetical protein HMPREF1544_12207 [Mucor circinelloides 1006PhL]